MHGPNYESFGRETFQNKVDLPILQSCLAQDQLQGRKQGWSFNTPPCDFGIKHVKGERYDVIATSFQNSIALSLLGSLDPYWESQLLVEYSKNLFTCKVLDGKMEDRRYKVVDGVIYFHDQIYLAKESKLKDQLLCAAYDIFLSNPTSFIWRVRGDIALGKSYHYHLLIPLV